MIDRGHALPLTAQARQLGISRGSIYYLPRAVPDADLAIMRRLDALHLLYPFAGKPDAARPAPAGGRRGRAVACRDADETDADRSDLPAAEYVEAVTGHKVYPYLLRNLMVTRPNQVWATDITYVPMARGFVYLVAIVDWFSRRVLAWRVSISLDAAFCIEALEEALARHGKPAIFNSDQGSQFTSSAFTAVLHREQIAISMDGKGRWRDNVFVERLWRSVKYEEVYLNAYASVPKPVQASAATSVSTMPPGRIPRLGDERQTRYTSDSRFSQRHEQPTAIHLSTPRACADKPSHL